MNYPTNIITVDAGKYQTKGLINNNATKFRTKIEEVDNSVQTNNKDYYIEWGGKHYLLGDGARFIDYDLTKHKLSHKLAVYTACSLLSKDTIPINLVVLAPMSLYTNKQAREEFRLYILDNKKIDFNLNHKNTQLNINDVTIFAEACGIPFNNTSKFKNKTVGLLDIGGLNVNGVIINNMKPVKGTEFTINAGSLIVMEKIRKELNKEIKGANIQEYQMDTILKQGYYNVEQKISKEIIQNTLSNHFKEIIQTTKANNWDIKGLDIVVSGGGSLDLGINNIKKYIPQAVLSTDPIWDNCIGGNKVGAMIYG